MATDEELKKFKEMLHNCIDEKFKAFDLRHAELEKRQGMITKFKKAMWR
jgi:DNA anti-recombination protein RmuC